MRKEVLVGWLAVLGFVLVSPAQAAVIPGQTIDGPGVNNLVFGDIDLAADGTGAVAYVKEVGSTDQIFVARRTGGAWQAPQPITTASADQKSPQVEAGNGGRVAVAYQNIADLEVRSSPATGQPFSAEGLIQKAVQRYDFEMNDAGVGYLVTSSPAGDIQASRYVGTTSTQVDNGGSLDKSSFNNAGTNDQAIAVDAAGNAVAAWDEEDGGNTDIYARRITGTVLGAAIEATVDSLAGAARSTGAQNVDVESDDAGNAWVAFREQFTYPVVNDRNRPLVRRLAGSAFGPALLLDPGPTPPANLTDAEFTRLAVTPAGDRAIASGFIQDANTNKPPLFGAALTPGAASPFSLEPPADAVPRTTAAIVPNGSALIAYAYKPNATTIQGLRGRVRSGGTGAFGAQSPLSDPTLGPVDSTNGPVASSNTGNTAVVGYLQGAAATARILVATVDLPTPGAGGGTTITPGTAATASVSTLRFSRTTFRKGRLLPKASAVKTGTTISFRLSEASKVRLSFESIRKGRKVGRRCRKPTRRNRRRRACKRYVKVKTAINLNGKAGVNRVRFQGRLTRRRSLRPGRYRLSVRAIGQSGKVSKPVRKNFRLLAAAKRK